MLPQLIFIGLMVFASLLVMLCNTNNKRSSWDTPVFEIAFCLFLVGLVDGLRLLVFDGTSYVKLAQWLLWDHAAYLMSGLLCYCIIGTWYAMVIWRWRIMPEVKARWEELLRGASSRESALDYHDTEYYLPKGETIVLPVLRYHAAHLGWLVLFWLFDLLSVVLGNSLRFVFLDFPRSVGTCVYNALRVQFERIARNVMK